MSKEEFTIGEILNHLINDNFEELKKQKLNKNFNKEHVLIGAGIVDSLKSHLGTAKRFIQKKGEDWVATLVKLIQTAFKTIGKWIDKLSVKFFMDFSVKIWRKMMDFAKHMVEATAQTVDLLLHNFQNLFSKLFNTFIDVTFKIPDTINKWINDLKDISFYYVKSAYSVFVEVFKVIGRFISRYWMFPICQKTNEIQNLTIISFIEPLARMVKSSSNVNVYFEFLILVEEIGRYITAANALKLDASDLPRYETFMLKLIDLGLSLDMPIYSLDMPFVTKLELVDIWNQKYGKSGKIDFKTANDLFFYAKSYIIEKATHDPILWKMYTETILSNRKVIENIDYMLSSLNTTYSPIPLNSEGQDEQALPRRSLSTLILNYNRRTDKDPKVAMVLNSFRKTMDLQHSIAKELPEEERREYLDSISKCAHELLRSLHKTKILQLERNSKLKDFPTNPTEEELKELQTFDRAGLPEALENCRLLNHGLSKLTPDNMPEMTTLIKQLIAKSKDVPINMKRDSSASSSDQGSSSSSSNQDPPSSKTNHKIITHVLKWIEKEQKNQTNKTFDKYLEEVEKTISEGRAVDDFCHVKGLKLVPSKVEEHGKDDLEKYIFFKIYRRVYYILTTGPRVTDDLNDMLDDYDTSLIKYDRIKRFLAWDNGMWYVGLAFGFVYLATEVAASYNGLLKPVAPYVTKEMLDPIKDEIKDAKDACDWFSEVKPTCEVEKQMLNNWNNFELKKDGITYNKDLIVKIVTELDSVIHSNTTEASLRINDYQEVASTVFTWIHKLTDENTKIWTMYLQDFVKTGTQATFKNHFEFIEGDKSLVYFNQLSIFANNVLFNVFPTIKAYNPGLEQNTHETFYKKIEIKSTELFSSKDTNYSGAIRNVDSIVNPNPSTSELTIYSAQVKDFVKQMTYNYIENIYTNMDIYHNILEDVVKIEQFINDLQNIKDDNLILADFIIAYNFDKLTLGKIDNIIVNKENITAIAFYNEYKDPLNILKTEYQSAVADLYIQTGQSAIQSTEPSRTLSNDIGLFFKKFTDPTDYETTKSILKNNPPKPNDNETIFYKKTLNDLKKFVPEICKTITIGNNNDSVFNTIVLKELCINIKKTDELEMILKGTTTDSDYYKFKKLSQPYVLFQQLIESKKSSELREFITSNVDKLNNPNTDIKDKFDIIYRFINYINDENNLDVKVSFIEYLAHQSSKTDLRDIFQDGLVILNNYRVDLHSLNININTFDLESLIHKNPFSVNTGEMEPYGKLNFESGSNSALVPSADELTAQKAIVAALETELESLKEELASQPNKDSLETQERIRVLEITNAAQKKKISEYEMARDEGNQNIETIERNTKLSQLLERNLFAYLHAIASYKYPNYTDKEINIYMEKIKAEICDYSNDSGCILNSKAEKYILENLKILKSYNLVQNLILYAFPPIKGNDNAKFNMIWNRLADFDNRSESIATTSSFDEISNIYMTSQLSQFGLNHMLAMVTRATQIIRQDTVNNMNNLGLIDRKEYLQGLVPGGDDFDTKIRLWLDGVYDTKFQNLDVFLKTLRESAQQSCNISLGYLDKRSESSRLNTNTTNTISALQTLSNPTQKIDKFFSIPILENTKDAITNVLKYISQQEKEWAGQLSNVDTRFSKVLISFMNSVNDHQTFIDIGFKTLTDEKMKTAWVEYNTHIMFTEIATMIDETISQSENDKAIKPVKSITIILETLKEIFSKMSARSHTSYTALFTKFNFSPFEELLSYYNLNRDYLKTLIDKRDDVKVLMENWQQSLSSYFQPITTSFWWIGFSKVHSISRAISRVGFWGTTALDLGLWAFSLYNATSEISNNILSTNPYNRDAMETINSFLSAAKYRPALGDGELTQGKLLRIGGRVKEPRTQFSNIYIALNELRPNRIVVSKNQMSSFTKWKKFIERGWYGFTDLKWYKKIMTLVMFAGGTFVLEPFALYNLVRHITQLVQHLLYDIIDVTYDVDPYLPVSSRSLFYLSITAVCTGKLFLEGIRQFNFNKDHLFESFPSITGHIKGANLLRTLSSALNFFSFISNAFTSAPDIVYSLFNNPFGSNTTSLISSVSNNSSPLQNAPNYWLTPLHALKIAINTYSVGSSSWRVLKSFNKDIDMLDIALYSYIILEQKYIKYQEKEEKEEEFKSYDINQTRYKIDPKPPSSINDILSKYGIIWSEFGKNIDYSNNPSSSSSSSEDTNYDIIEKILKDDTKKILINEFKKFEGKHIPSEHSTRLLYYIVHRILINDNCRKILLENLLRAENDLQIYEFVEVFVDMIGIPIILQNFDVGASKKK